MTQLEQNSNTSWRSLSSFSVILIMIVLMIVGGVMLPLVNVQYAPQEERTAFTVSFSYPGASARVVEQEVTSKIEGALNSIEGVRSTKATSRQGRGSIAMWFKKGVKIDAARFEVATQIRQIYDKLPDGVSYPTFNMSVSGGNNVRLMSYTINADLPADRIVKYAEENITPHLSRIEGVQSVSLSGATPFRWEITFDPDAMRAAGISVSDISNAFSQYFGDNIVGTVSDGEQSMMVRLKNATGTKMTDIPVKSVGGRVYYLRDFASVAYRETPPSSYDRINGLTTISMTIMADAEINTLRVTDKIKETMASLERNFPQNYTALLSYDSSIEINKELNKIYFRSGLSLLILLLFVWAVSRSLRYLFVIFLSILVNLLVAVIFYYLGHVDIHLYSMAGITISLGIIIDTAIVMVDHFSYYKDRRVFTSILGATLTTVAALMVIFFLPDSQKRDLIDFVWVIVINLSVSVFIALLFIPALLDKIPLDARGVSHLGYKGKRRVAKFSRYYTRYIAWGRRHRWIFIVVLILGFGIPVHMLPRQVTHNDKEKSKTGGWVGLYNKTIGGTWYQEHKKPFEVALGGSFRIFAQNFNGLKFYRQPEPQKILYVRAGMPEGCTVQQLDEVVRVMENFLSQFKEVDMYRTTVFSYDNAYMEITFKKEAENTGFPYMLKQRIIQKANSYGGATWRVYGVDENGFNNNVIAGGWKQYKIRLTGYNYDMLYRYAQTMIDSLSTNKRVSEPEIMSDEYSYRSTAANEFFLSYDPERVARTGLNTSLYYQYLRNQLYNNPVGSVFDGQETSSVQLISANKDAFDLWHIRNEMIDIDTVKTRLSEIGNIEKRRSGNDINRYNQEYRLFVAFDFIGPGELAKRVSDRCVKKFNEDILPIGYKAASTDRILSSKEKKQQTGLLLLIIVIIYGICSIIFESLLKPLVIILMIPVGFIGLFLTFAWGGVTFDQGGFASMVMLCGIVVNAGIYIISEYNTIRSRTAIPPVQVYIKAYNRKIMPTLLTILSTVLGLIPFLFDGKDEVFWFAFAVGVMGGMAFSIVALVLYLPIFMPFGGKREKKSRKCRGGKSRRSRNTTASEAEKTGMDGENSGSVSVMQ